jgi:hypothetical protein
VQRLSILQRSPLATLAGVALASAAIRFAVALQVRTPLYYPDEYLYGAISRSFAHGMFGKVRGARLPLREMASYLAPLLTSPFWLAHDVAVAYRLSQALASIVFASSAFASYALARRVGIDGRGACIVGILTLLIPSGAFTATLLTEPYAYPLFLLAMLAAVDAIASPSLLRVLIVGALAAGLCAAAGFQFLLFAPGCLVAYVLTSESPRSGLRRSLIVALISAAIVAGLAIVDGGAFANVVRAQAFHYSVGGTAAWFGVNAFVLAVSSGWVLVPGAMLGFWGLASGGDRRARAFAALSVLLILGFLAEAAIWGSNGLGLYERFTFYGSPLLAIAFVWSMRMRGKEQRRSLYASIAYVTAAAAILLPLSSRLFFTDDHSLTLLGLSYGVIVHLSSPPLLWAPLLGALAVLTGLFGLQHQHAVAVGAAIVCLVTGVAGSRALIDLDAKVVSRVSLHGPAAYLTDGSGDHSYLEQTLFWNPDIDRVLVLGGAVSTDGFASTPVFAGPSGLLLTKSGGPIPGPFVIGPDTLAVNGGGLVPGRGELATSAKRPTVIAFGWYRKAGLLAPFGRLFAADGQNGGFRLILKLSSIRGRQTIGLKCASLPTQTFKVGTTPTTITIRVPDGGVRDCRFGLVSGGVYVVRSLHVIARASLTVAR